MGIYPPCRIDHGDKTTIGKNFFANSNLIILDHGGVTIGDNVLIAPNVTITSTAHPFVAEQRRVRHLESSFEPGGRGCLEYNSPVTIGNDVWLCTGVIVCPGVTIGDGAVIGAGSVVTEDVPANVFACGVPCQVVRELGDSDLIDAAVWEAALEEASAR